MVKNRKHVTRKHATRKRVTRKRATQRTRRSKSYRRRHTRKGGACPCAMRLRGGRGLGGSELGHAYTTGASQTLYQLSGRTPGLSN